MEQNVPVVLDCYAEWCGPCKKLMPLITQKIKEINGWDDADDEDSGKPVKVKLVKMDIDAVPQLSQALQIRSVPSVYLIYKGNVVDMF